jgi:hypothetical protein
MMMLSKFVALLALAATASPAIADAFDDVTVGDPMTDAERKMGRYGSVKPIKLGRFDGLLVGDYVVLGCEGRVWSLSRSLRSDFRSFVNAAKKAELRFGFAPRVSITSDDGRDQQSAVELNWDLDGSKKWTLTYMSNAEGFGVGEGVQSRLACNQD